MGTISALSSVAADDNSSHNNRGMKVKSSVLINRSSSAIADVTQTPNVTINSANSNPSYPGSSAQAANIIQSTNFGVGNHSQGTGFDGKERNREGKGAMTTIEMKEWYDKQQLLFSNVNPCTSLPKLRRKLTTTIDSNAL